MHSNERLREIQDECRNLGLAFALFLDLRRFSELAALFTSDAMFHRANGVTAVGRDDIEKAQATRPHTLQTIHQVSPALVEVTGAETAKGLSNFVAIAFDSTQHSEPVLRGAGFFEDRYRIEDGRWLIAERKTVVIGARA